MESKSAVRRKCLCHQFGDVAAYCPDRPLTRTRPRKGTFPWESTFRPGRALWRATYMLSGLRKQLSTSNNTLIYKGKMQLIRRRCKPRAASGPRSTGTRTGPHGACLTAAVWRSGQNTRQSKPRETRFWSRAIGVEAGGECRKRERRKAARRQDSSARPRLTRTLIGQCAFRRSASLFFAGGKAS